MIIWILRSIVPPGLSMKTILYSVTSTMIMAEALKVRSNTLPQWRETGSCMETSSAHCPGAHCCHSRLEYLYKCSSLCKWLGAVDDIVIGRVCHCHIQVQRN